MNLPPLTVLDFETTGSVPGFPNEPWQIGLCTLEVRSPRSEVRSPDLELRTLDFGLSAISGSWLRVSPDRPFNRYAPGRHAQLRDVLADAPALPDLWPTLEPRLVGVPLVAHNIGTERTVLSGAFPLHPFGPWIDTLVLARLAWPGLPSYALEDLVPALGLSASLSALCPFWAPHDARYDAVAAALLLRHLLSLPGWDSLSADELADLR